MIARYPGTCLACHGRIEPGQEIEKTAERRYAHKDCSNTSVSTSTQKAHTYKDPNAPATEGQRNLITKLSFERVVPDGLVIPVRETMVTMSQAGEIIDRLFEAPVAARQPLPGPDIVPAGRYAIELEMNGQTYDFIIRVWRGSYNPNAVKVYNDDTGQVVNKHDALKRLVEYGVSLAARRYGKLRGKCYRCNAKLKKRISVELGVGETVCLEHLYGKETAKALRASARQVIRDRGEDPNETVESLREAEQLALEVTA